MEIWEDPVVLDRILDYLDTHQFLASFTSLGGLPLREGAHCHCSEPRRVGDDLDLRCEVSFEELVGYGAAAAQRLRQSGEVHLRLDAAGQVKDAWLCRPDSC